MFLPALNHHIHYHCNPFFAGHNMMNNYMNYMMGSFLGASLFSLASIVCGNYQPYKSFSCMPYSNPFNFMNNNYQYFGVNNFGIGAYNTYTPVYTPFYNQSYGSSYTPRFQYIPQPFGSGYTVPNIFLKSNFSTVKKTKTNSFQKETAKINTDGKILKKDKNLYGKEFLNKVKQIAKNLHCNYRDLLAVMNAESGINSSIKNPNGSATGLIQFVESTARSLGTSTAELARMTPVEQLDYVEKYLTRVKSSAGFSPNDELSAGDLYALVFLPARAKSDVLTTSGETYYTHNKGTDINKDGKITKQELAQRIHNHYVSDKSFLA